MKNFGYLLLALVFFGLAYLAYWVVTNEPPPETGSTRSLSPRAVTPPSALMQFVQQWQPILTLISSLGGAISFFMQVRVWLRGRNA